MVSTNIRERSGLSVNAMSKKFRFTSKWPHGPGMKENREASRQKLTEENPDLSTALLPPDAV